MVAQGGGLGGGSAAATSSKRGSAAKPVKAGAAKLSFKDKHALEQLPREIAIHESEIVRLRRVLSDGNLFRRDPAKFTRSTDALAAAEVALAAAEERWLELSVLRETLGG